MRTAMVAFMCVLSAISNIVKAQPLQVDISSVCSLSQGVVLAASTYHSDPYCSSWATAPGGGCTQWKLFRNGTSITAKYTFPLSSQPNPPLDYYTYGHFLITQPGQYQIKMSYSRRICSGWWIFNTCHFDVYVNETPIASITQPDIDAAGQNCKLTPVAGDVRLRHEATGKCLVGNFVEGGPVKTWACWADPEMAVSLEPLGGSDVRIRMRAREKCLFGSTVNGGDVKNWSCWSDPNMTFVREDLGNNRVRLRHKATGRCMYSGNNDGDSVKNWACWSDPAMVWVIDPF